MSAPHITGHPLGHTEEAEDEDEDSGTQHL